MLYVATIILGVEYLCAAGIAIGVGYYADHLRKQIKALKAQLPVRNAHGKFTRRR